MTSNIIFLRCGQCGNQLGHEITRNLYENSVSGNVDSDSEFLEPFFRNSKAGKLYSRSICLDTEPKVINDCLNQCNVKNSGWSLDPRSVAYRHGGAGNNWALGYQMFSGEFLEIGMNLLRRELEHCDLVPLLFSIHSLAGGTGSGLGTRLSEEVCDLFPEILKVNLAILPYHFGEVVVQYYNSVLSLSKLLQCTDGTILFENESAVEICKQTRGIDRPSLSDINRIIADNISPVLTPKYALNSPTVPWGFDDDIMHLCSHNSYKIMDVKCVPQTYDISKSFTYDSWNALLRSLSGMQLGGEYIDRSSHRSRANYATFSSVITCRGTDAVEGCGVAQQTMNLWSLKWSSNPSKLCFSSRSCNGYDRSASILSCSQSILPTMTRILSKSSEMFKSGAYLHQYECNNVSIESFKESFYRVAQTIENYKALSS